VREEDGLPSQHGGAVQVAFRIQAECRLIARKRLVSFQPLSRDNVKTRVKIMRSQIQVVPLQHGVCVSSHARVVSLGGESQEPRRAADVHAQLVLARHGRRGADAKLLSQQNLRVKGRCVMVMRYKTSSS
jgi:hypothetical protein